MNDEQSQVVLLLLREINGAYNRSNELLEEIKDILQSIKDDGVMAYEEADAA